MKEGAILGMRIEEASEKQIKNVRLTATSVANP